MRDRALLTREALARFDLALPIPACSLRIRTERPCHLHTLRRIVVDILRRDDLLQRDERVGASVGGRARAEVAEGIRSGTEAAVEHAGREEQAIEILRLGDAAGLLRDAVEILRRHPGRDRAVEQAVILEQLAAATVELAEIGLRRVHQRSELGARGRQVFGEIESAVVPIQLLEYEATEVAA